MNERDLEAAVLRALAHAAGGVGDRPIEPDRPFEEQFEVDMDRFFRALARETGIDIPAEDQPRLQTLSGCLDYLSRDLAD
jgi:acyl carrier protein